MKENYISLNMHHTLHKFLAQVNTSYCHTTNDAQGRNFKSFI